MNINQDLIDPFTRHISLSWSKFFEDVLFDTFDTKILARITELIKDVEVSAADALKDRVTLQGEQCRALAEITLNEVRKLVKIAMNKQQKDLSRSLGPYIRDQLKDTYKLANEQKFFWHLYVSYLYLWRFDRGSGSVVRQKVQFLLHGFSHILTAYF